jgi:hypothetical protein
MYRREPRHQLSFEDFFLLFGGKLSGDNRWINRADHIPWDELDDDYTAKFCKDFGAPAKPFRIALGAAVSCRCQEEEAPYQQDPQGHPALAWPLEAQSGKHRFPDCLQWLLSGCWTSCLPEASGHQ